VQQFFKVVQFVDGPQARFVIMICSDVPREMEEEDCDEPTQNVDVARF
jgi:hypothetical protein